MAEVFPELVVYDTEGRPETVKYHVLSTLLLNELQRERGVLNELQRERERVASELAVLRAEVAGLQQR